MYRIIKLTTYRGLTRINFDAILLLGRFRGEPAIFDESIPTLLLPRSEVPCEVHNEEKPPPVTVSVRFPIEPAANPVVQAPVPAVPPLPAAAAPAIPALPA